MPLLLLQLRFKFLEMIKLEVSRKVQVPDGDGVKFCCPCAAGGGRPGAVRREAPCACSRGHAVALSRRDEIQTISA